MKRLLALSLLAASAAVAPHAASRTQACGVERWAVKTLADPAAATVDYASVKRTTIPQLSALPSDQPAAREAPTETTVYQLTGTHLVAAKQEADSDFHLVLRSPLAGHPTMIAEIPDPSCVTPNPDPAALAAQQQAAQARAAFLAQTGISPGGQWWNGDLVVTLRGVGFLDRPHHQTGVAANAIELHPVLYFHRKP